MRASAAAAVVALLGTTPAASAARLEGTEDVLLVDNNRDGTAHVVDPKRFTRLEWIDIVPDLEQRRAEVFRDPVDLSLCLGIRALIGEGHDQLVDDMFTSHDGRTPCSPRPRPSARCT